MIEPRIDKIEEWWSFPHGEERTAEAVEVIINAAGQGKSIKRVLRRMAASAPQHFVWTEAVAWRTRDEWPSPEGVTITAAFYALMYKRTVPQALLGRGIESLVEPCVQMTRQTIAMYEASPNSRFAILQLLALQRMLSQTLEHLSKAIIELVHQQIPQADPAPEDSHIDWISQSVELYQHGKKEESLDIIFDFIDDMLLSSRFSDCDRLLLQLSVEDLSNPQLLTVLTATLAAKEHLASRATFVDRVKSELGRRGADASRLLAGLE
jgi:hypothetical protein